MTMNNIMINDLEVNVALDQQALSELIGGGQRWKKYGKYAYYYKRLYRKHGYYHQPHYGHYNYYEPKYVKAYYFKPVYKTYGYYC